MLSVVPLSQGTGRWESVYSRDWVGGVSQGRRNRLWRDRWVRRNWNRRIKQKGEEKTEGKEEIWGGTGPRKTHYSRSFLKYIHT